MSLPAVKLAWQDEAACLGKPNAWFYPEPPPGKVALAGNAYDAGKAVCAGCPVREACLAYALAERIDDGLWGGVAPKTRARMPRPLAVKQSVCERPGCRREFDHVSPLARWCSPVCKNWWVRETRRRTAA